VLGWTTQHFQKKGVDAPRLTAEVLLAHALSTTRVRLYVDLDRPLEPKELKSFRALIERRTAGEPTQYLTGEREFYNRKLAVDARVLVPRPETELLAEAVLRALPADAPARVLDLCTGSGCLAVTVAAEREQWSVLATDLSPGACEVARMNVEAHGVGSRVTVREGDLYAAVPDGMAERVVSTALREAGRSTGSPPGQPRATDGAGRRRGRAGQFRRAAREGPAFPKLAAPHRRSARPRAAPLLTGPATRR
jgi:release factor glutamine methyltransferase